MLPQIFYRLVHSFLHGAADRNRYRCERSVPRLLSNQTLLSDALRINTLAELLSTFDRHGAVIFPSFVADSLLYELMLAQQRFVPTDTSMRDPFDGSRYSTGSRVTPLAYAELFKCPMLCMAIAALADHGGSSWQCGPLLNPVRFGKGGGDVARARAGSWQEVHSDSAWFPTSNMSRGYFLVFSIACSIVAPTFAPIAIFPWSLRAYQSLPYPQDARGDTSFLISLKKGEVLLRDCRAAHCGTPNLTDSDRFLPGGQILNPLGFWTS